MLAMIKGHSYVNRKQPLPCMFVFAGLIWTVGRGMVASRVRVSCGWSLRLRSACSSSPRTRWVHRAESHIHQNKKSACQPEPRSVSPLSRRSQSPSSLVSASRICSLASYVYEIIRRRCTYSIIRADSDELCGWSSAINSLQSHIYSAAKIGANHLLSDVIFAISFFHLPLSSRYLPLCACQMWILLISPDIHKQPWEERISCFRQRVFFMSLSDVTEPVQLTCCCVGLFSDLGVRGEIIL